MKIRIGFVSNSSTSSFAIVGGIFSADEMNNIAVKNPKSFTIEGTSIESREFSIEWLGEDGEECVLGVSVKDADLAGIKKAFAKVEKLFGGMKEEIKLISGYSDMGGYTGLD